MDVHCTNLSILLSCVLSLAVFGVVIANHPLNQRLKTWETISVDDIAIHREKRSAGSKVMTVDKEVSFNAFNRQFRLSLISSPGVFASDFRAGVYGRHGREEVILDKTSLYSGTLMGEPGSTVRAHLDGRELMASIKTKHDTYIIEPSWRHLPEDEKGGEKSSKMIVYRRSDLNTTKYSNYHANDSFCGIDSIMDEIHDHEKKEKFTITDTDSHRISKRSSSGKLKKVCTLALVADFRFYEEMGNSNRLQTMYYLINLIERVNHIFKTTDWGSEEEAPKEYEGYGFQISDIKVYNESTQDPSFNDDVNWSAKGLLEAFSEKNHGHCLAHLFTYVDFDKGVLGLAYVGASKPSAVGGICTRPYDKGNGKRLLYLNTGLTTARNWGQRILTLEADLVTTHELGHNFGAEHDNGEVEECSPGASNNGNFIMYPAAVSGENENNDRFSICSKHNVLPCLKRKAPECFHEAKEAFCGNLKVEDGEECDVGYFAGANAGEDACCTKDCKLKKGKPCSNKNSVCCNEDCRAASRTRLCYSGVSDSCLKDTYCDGTHFTCPPHLHRDDDESCGDAGKCKEGKCQPYCATVGKKACLCTDEKENYCRRCCVPIDAEGSDMITKCEPYIPSNTSGFLQLKNNARCTLGYCKEGECIKQTQDVIERVWSIFEHIAPDKIGEFLADNIVGAVLVFSLLFWVPCGCLVNFVDKKREKQRMKEDQWFTEKGSDFYRTTNAYGGMFGSSTTINNPMQHKSQKANVSGVLAARAGQNAKDQWRASREKASRRKSIDGLNGQSSTNSQEDRFGRGDAIFIKSTAQPQPQPLPPQFGKPKVNIDLNDGNTSNASRSSTPRPQLIRQDVTVDTEEPM